MERLVILVICAPLAFLFGWFFFLILRRGFSDAGDWVSIVARVLGTEFVGALFLIFFFASIWALTGRDRFDHLLMKQLWRLLLVSFITTALLILFAVLFK